MARADLHGLLDQGDRAARRGGETESAMNLPAVLGLLHAPAGVVVVLGAVMCAAVVSAVLPLRGGNGQHAHAGPGTTSVWQIREAVAADARRRNAPAYTGKHRRLDYDVIIQPLIAGRIAVDPGMFHGTFHGVFPGMARA